MKQSHENNANEATNEARQPEPGTTPDINDIMSEENTTMRKSHDHDTYQDSSGRNWPVPTPFESPGNLEGCAYEPMLYPPSFLPIAYGFSRMFNASYEAVSAILMFLLASAIGDNVRVKQATGEWDTLRFRLGLLSESMEKASAVLWTMGCVFLERRFLLKAALATGQMTGGVVSTALEAKLSELCSRANKESWPLDDFLNAIAALPKVPAGATKSAGSARKKSGRERGRGDNQVCLGLEWADSAKSILPDEDNLVVNLNGSLHSHSSSAGSTEIGDSSAESVFAFNPAILSVFLVAGIPRVSKLPFALVDWAPGSDWDARDMEPADTEGLKELGNLLMRAFDLQQHSVQNPINLVLCDQARSHRDATYLSLACGQGRPDVGPQRSEDASEVLRLASKIAALFSLWESEGDFGEISVECWSRGVDIASTLFENQQSIKHVVLVHPDASKAEPLLQSAATLSTPFTVGEILQKECGGIVDVDGADPAIAVLIQLGWVRVVATAEEGQEEQFEFHPLAFERAASDSTPDASIPSDQPGAE